MLRELLIVTAIAGSARADSSARVTLELDTSSTRPATGDADTGASIGGTIAGSAESEPYFNSASFARGSASVALRGGTDGAGLTIDQHATARPYAFELFQVELGDRLVLDEEPRLSDRPDRWRRRYSDAGFDFNVIGVQHLGRRFGAQLIRVDNGFDWETQHDGAIATARFITTADWAPLSFTLRDHGRETARFDPLVLEARGIGGPTSGVVMEQLTRATGIPIGPIRADVAIGTASTGSSAIMVDNQTVSTITSVDLPAMKVAAGRARLAVTLGGVDASVGAERGMYLAADSELVVEQRATAALATTIGKTRVAASGFLAHSVMWSSPTASSEHVTGGGAVTVDLALADRWRLSNQVELARTFYGSLDGDRALRVDTALRIDAALRHDIKNWTH